MKDTVLTIRVPSDMREDLRTIAAVRETTASIEHRRALRAFVDAERDRLGLLR